VDLSYWRLEKPIDHPPRDWTIGRLAFALRPLG